MGRAVPQDLLVVAPLRDVVENVGAVVPCDHLVRLFELRQRLVGAKYPAVQPVQAICERFVQAHDVVELGAYGGGERADVLQSHQGRDAVVAPVHDQLSPDPARKEVLVESRVIDDQKEARLPRIFVLRNRLPLDAQDFLESLLVKVCVDKRGVEVLPEEPRDAVRAAQDNRLGQKALLVDLLGHLDQDVRLAPVALADDGHVDRGGLDGVSRVEPFDHLSRDSGCFAFNSK